MPRALRPLQTHTDGTLNYLDLDLDSDNDGVSDQIEYAFGFDPYDDQDVPSIPIVGWTLALLSGVLLLATVWQLKKEGRRA